MTMGGSEEIPLKYENGARLTSPLRLMLLIQPIGRGATNALNGLCVNGLGADSLWGRKT